HAAAHSGGATRGSGAGRPGAHPGGRGFLSLVSLLCCPAAAAPRAEPAPRPAVVDAYVAAFFALEKHEIAALGLTLGILAFAVVTAILLLRTRERAANTESRFRDEVMALKAEVDRVNALLLSEPQIIVSWAAAGNEPEILGDTSLVAAGPVAERVLAFGSWLEPDKAQAMEHAVEALRGRGEGFSMTLTTLADRPLEAEGRAIGGRAILRLRDVSGLKRELAEVAARHQKLRDDVDSLHTL